ncbi:hypothetical protein CHS0354_024468 [Potamilus streckersoni]|uniref:Uncharacterized protein n=1 Tax=Potamilus streckersoni TaxID=2493646 RepID=A0AAE0TMW5_9BIVA|nr:hypothetical protein CHS0354_024468 [Potamilus streckersoni]
MGLLFGQEPSGQLLHGQPVVGYGSDHASAGYPQTQYPYQQAGQYPAPQRGYYPSQYVGQYPEHGYISQQGQTFVVAAPRQQTIRTQQAPQDYINRAIFATLCCFWPTGICAIIKACDARQALARGDVASARESSESARKLTMISIIAGVLSIVVVCIIVGVYVGIAVNSVHRSNHFRNETMF